MSSLKKFVREEIKNVLQKENLRIQLRELEQNLFEAVNTTSSLKKKTMSAKTLTEIKKNYKKYKSAKKITEDLETKLSKNYKVYEGYVEGEGKMLRAQLLSIMENAERLYHMVDEGDMLEDWVQSKVTVAEDYLRAVASYIKYYNGEKNMEDNYKLDGDDEFEYGETDYDDEDAWDEIEVEDGELDYEDDLIDDEDIDDDEIDSDEIWDDEDEFEEYGAI